MSKTPKQRLNHAPAMNSDMTQERWDSIFGKDGTKPASKAKKRATKKSVKKEVSDRIKKDKYK